MSTEGTFDKAKGRTKEAAGDLTGDRELQREGQKDQTGGKIKDAIGDVKDKATDLVDKAKGDKK